MNDLLSLVLTLHLADDAPAGEDKPLPLWWGRAAHALVLRLLDAADPALARRIHDDPSAPRPFTVSTLWGGRIAAGEAVTLRLTALNGALADILRGAANSGGALAPGASVELDGRSFSVQEAAWETQQHPWAASRSYRDVASAWLMGKVEHPPRQISLDLASPVTFKTGGRHLPLPLPELVFGSLLMRWNAFAPFALPEETRRYAAECLVLTRYNLRSRRVTLKPGQRRIGAVGQVTFRTLNYDRYWMSVLHALAEFSFFAGLGAGTTMGLGQCRRST